MLNFKFQLFVASLSNNAEGFSLQWQSHFFCESGTVIKCAGNTPCVFQVLVFGGVVVPLLIKEFEPAPTVDLAVLLVNTVQVKAVNPASSVNFLYA